MTTTRSTTITDDDCTRYTVSGDLGAVTCSTLPGSSVPFLLDFHCPPEDGAGLTFPCEVLPGGTCCPEAACGASQLRWAWYESGHDSEVIWTALERLYAQMGRA